MRRVSILNTSTFSNCSMSSKRLGITGLLLSCIAISHAQSNPSKSSDGVDIRSRIAAIVQQRLDDGVFIVNGIRAQTRTPPSNAAVEEIKRYGDSAVPVLAGYLHSKRPFESCVAVEFLGLLGGRRIVPLLQRVIQHDPSATLRELALRWLTQAPPNLAQPIIRRAAKTDPDEKVRKTAKNILETGSPDGMPDLSVPFKKTNP